MARKINHRKNLLTSLEEALVSLKALLAETESQTVQPQETEKKTRRGRKSKV